MIWKGRIATLGLLVIALTWSGCATQEAPRKYECSDDDIRVGDSLTISLLDIPDPLLDKKFDVRSDGLVNLPLLGSVKALGKKFGDFEKELQNRYITNNIYRQVTVVVKAGDRFYTLGGEIKSGGRLPYLGQTTVLRAIASGSDFTDFANRRKVEIIRANGEREIMDCIQARKDPKKHDRPICPGDAIFVPRSL